MVDRFLQAGFDYFDTALLYPGSEPAVKKALTDRIPRERYRLATKLNAMIAPTEKAAKQQLTTSLERTGAGYFDYYLLHALMDINWRRYEKFHLWEFLSEQKALGRVRKIGFSFHAGPELLDWLLTEHPEVDFVQLQINYRRLGESVGPRQGELRGGPAAPKAGHRHGAGQGRPPGRSAGQGQEPAESCPSELVLCLLGHPLCRLAGRRRDRAFRYVHGGPDGG